jgi:deoxyribonuclease V
MDLTQLEKQQSEWAKKVVIPTEKQTDYQPKSEDLIFSFDIQYQGEEAYIAADVQRFDNSQLGIFVTQLTATVPYVPQFFCFREAPLLLALLEKIEAQKNIKPDFIVIDGHGLAHPRKFGVACYIGVETQIPTIGCAKETLVQYTGNLGEKKGESLPIWVENQLVGSVLRTQDGIKPVFVSAGNLVSLETAQQMILHLTPTYRISEPLRRADQAARGFAKGEKGNWIVLN